MIGYGLIHVFQLTETIEFVCEVLGRGANNNASQMVMETCAQETKLGSYLDHHPNSHGVGPSQIDKIAFDDIKERTSEDNKRIVYNIFGIKIDDVEHMQLAYSPVLAIIFTRLFYMLIPKEFPLTVEGRADYWKKYYNTEAGRGTVEQYIENANRYCQ